MMMISTTGDFDMYECVNECDSVQESKCTDRGKRTALLLCVRTNRFRLLPVILPSVSTHHEK